MLLEEPHIGSHVAFSFATGRVGPLFPLFSGGEIPLVINRKKPLGTEIVRVFSVLQAIHDVLSTVSTKAAEAYTAGKLSDVMGT